MRPIGSLAGLALAAAVTAAIPAAANNLGPIVLTGQTALAPSALGLTEAKMMGGKLVIILNGQVVSIDPAGLCGVQSVTEASAPIVVGGTEVEVKHTTTVGNSGALSGTLEVTVDSNTKTVEYTCGKPEVLRLTRMTDDPTGLTLTMIGMEVPMDLRRFLVSGESATRVYSHEGVQVQRVGLSFFVRIPRDPGEVYEYTLPDDALQVEAEAEAPAPAPASPPTTSVGPMTLGPAAIATAFAEAERQARKAPDAGGHNHGVCDPHIYGVNGERLRGNLLFNMGRPDRARRLSEVDFSGMLPGTGDVELLEELGPDQLVWSVRGEVWCNEERTASKTVVLVGYHIAEGVIDIPHREGSMQWKPGKKPRRSAPATQSVSTTGVSELPEGSYRVSGAKVSLPITTGWIAGESVIVAIVGSKRNHYLGPVPGGSVNDVPKFIGELLCAYPEGQPDLAHCISAGQVSGTVTFQRRWPEEESEPERETVRLDRNGR